MWTDLSIMVACMKCPTHMSGGSTSGPTPAEIAPHKVAGELTSKSSGAPTSPEPEAGPS